MKKSGRELPISNAARLFLFDVSSFRKYRQKWGFGLGLFKPFSDFYRFLARNNCRSDMPDFTIQDTDLDEFADLDDASSLFACDSDVLFPCDPVAFGDAGITLLLILALAFCVSLFFKWYRN